MKKYVRANTESITLDQVYNILGEYDGGWTNPKNGWSGECEIYQRDLEDGNYLFSLVFGGNNSEADQVMFCPNGSSSSGAIFTIMPYHGEFQWANTLDELRRALRKEYSYLRRVNASTRTAKRSVTASYGGWNKFYGLPDVEFTVPNDMDDPTIYYEGNYYNYYDVEDILWDMFGEYCEETGVIKDEDMFEQWVSENPDEVYGILSDIQPKKSRGRGVRRDGEMYTSASRRSRGRRITASEDFDNMTWQEFKKKYKDTLKKYPGIGDLWGRNYTITLTTENYEKQGSRWVLVESNTETIPFEYYMNAIDASPFFKNLGGKESISKSYTVAGYVPVEIRSTSPDGKQKTIRKYDFSL